MMLVRDELEELQADRLLPKRLNTRTNSWLSDANELLSNVLDTAEGEAHEQINEIAQILERKFSELVVE